MDKMYFKKMLTEGKFVNTLCPYNRKKDEKFFPPVDK